MFEESEEYESEVFSTFPWFVRNFVWYLLFGEGFGNFFSSIYEPNASCFSWWVLS